MVLAYSLTVWREQSNYAFYWLGGHALFFFFREFVHAVSAGVCISHGVTTALGASVRRSARTTLCINIVWLLGVK